MITTEIVFWRGEDTLIQELHNGKIEVVTIVTYDNYIGSAWIKTTCITYDGYHTLGQALLHRNDLEEAYAYFQADYATNGETVTHLAAENGNVEMLQWILDNQEKLELDDNFWNKRSIAHTAAHSDSVQVLQWLLDNQERLRLPSNFCNKRTINGEKLVHAAARSGSAQVLQWLLDHKERLGLAGDFWKEEVDDGYDHWYDESDNENDNNNGDTIAFIACSTDKVSVLQWLLDNQERLGLAGDFWNEEFNQEENSIAHAAAHAGSIRVLQWLLDNQKKLGLEDKFWHSIIVSSVQFDEDEEMWFEETVISVLAKSGKARSIKWLLDNEEVLGLSDLVFQSHKRAMVNAAIELRIDHPYLIGMLSSRFDTLRVPLDEVSMQARRIYTLIGAYSPLAVIAHIIVGLLYSDKIKSIAISETRALVPSISNESVSAMVDASGPLDEGVTAGDGQCDSEDHGAGAISGLSISNDGASRQQLNNLNLEIKTNGKINQNKVEKHDEHVPKIAGQNNVSDSTSSFLIQKLVADLIDNLPDTDQAREYVSNYKKIITEAISSTDEKMRNACGTLFSNESPEERFEKEFQMKQISCEGDATIHCYNTTNLVDDYVPDGDVNNLGMITSVIGITSMTSNVAMHDF